MAEARSDGEGDQSALIAALFDERAYPHSVSRVELLETHISWVFLTGKFAYKIKKSLELEFLDFSTLDKRRHFCDEELRLNRRWAPMLYLEVVPICRGPDGPVVGGDGEIIEYALKMRQFPQSARLDNQLDAGELDAPDMRALAETIAGYHEDAPRIDFASTDSALSLVREPMRENFRYVRPVTGQKALRQVEEWTEQQLTDLGSVIISRHKGGYVRECHGDLHLANLVRLSEGIVAFDCVEFSAALRDIDVISDVAFLFMDLTARQRSDLAHAMINRYLERSGDYPGMSVFGLYFVYHCMIRAKVAAIRSAERDEEEGRRHDLAELDHYLEVAADWIERPAPTLVAMRGYSGSGKTWLSSQLMSELPAIRVRSDIERKRAFGIGETASSGSAAGAGIYSERASASVYEDLLRIAESLLDCGFNVIVDASFLRQADRECLQALAQRLQRPFVFVETSAAKDELARRLARRNAAADDASEADRRILDYQYGSAEPLTTEERRRTIVVSTDADVDIRDVSGRIAQSRQVPT